MTAPKDEAEWTTRKTRIDTRLVALGWQILPFSRFGGADKCDRHAVAEYQTDNGPADYALFVADRMLGIIEANKLSLGPQNALIQAERYSGGATTSPLHFGEFRVPFLYSTNGEVIWYHDVRHPPERSRRIAELPTPPPSTSASHETSTPNAGASPRSPKTIRAYGPTSARPTRPSKPPSPPASVRCSSRWRRGAARPS